MSDTPDGPNPGSVIRVAGGHPVELKVHRCNWSGTYPENSLPAIEECYRERVARAEIDLHMLRDADFLVLHDPGLDATTTGSGAIADLTRDAARSLRLRFGGGVSAERPPLFSEVLATIAVQPYPTLLELDLPASRPLPWDRLEWLARAVGPLRDRVIFNGADWNLRRLLRVDPTLPMSLDPGTYLDWLPEGDAEQADMEMPRGAYGYFDAHPLARQRFSSVGDYLTDRLGGIVRLVPGAREVHLRLRAFERMLDDGVAEAADLFHRHGLLLDVWTLNAGMPDWHQRLSRVLAAGVDVVTTDTPQALAAAGDAIL